MDATNDIDNKAVNGESRQTMGSAKIIDQNGDNSRKPFVL